MEITIGLPRMHKEPGEVRDFLPDFVAFLSRRGAGDIVLEHGYGAGMGFRESDYLRVPGNIRFGSYEECLAADIVVVIRAPGMDALERMSAGSMLLTMLHYTTNPDRNSALVDLKIHAISLDSITDDRGRRLIENISAVGWNGMEVAFRELNRTFRGFEDPARRPISLTILGAGAVAGAAGFAAARYGDHDVHSRLVAKHVRGVETTMVDYDLTWDEDYMLSRLEQSDILVDATRRPDPTRIVIPNRWLASLPDHAVVVDLTADPYDFSVVPSIVKAIEGVPHGDLDHFVFAIDDPAYEELARRVDTEQRRVALSCYSWPGIHPRQCMDLYGGQMERVMGVVLARPLGTFDITSDDHLERALARAEVARWMHMSNASR